MTIYAISYSVSRNDPFATSFDLYAKAGSAPQWDGDGVFIGNVPILPWQSSISGTWTPPSNGSWYLGAVARALDRYSKIGLL